MTMQAQVGISNEIISVIQGSLILFVASNYIVRYLFNRRTGKEKAYDKLQIGTLQIQGFPALTKSEKQKMSYHITPKAVCGYPASGFFAWIA